MSAALPLFLVARGHLLLKSSLRHGCSVFVDCLTVAKHCYSEPFKKPSRCRRPQRRSSSESVSEVTQLHKSLSILKGREWSLVRDGSEWPFSQRNVPAMNQRIRPDAFRRRGEKDRVLSGRKSEFRRVCR